MNRVLLVVCALAAFARPAAAEVFIDCHIQVVGTFETRVHILCDQPFPSTTIQYFATPASNREMASRMEAIGLVAQVTGASVFVYFNLADTSGSSFGCQASDCRKITGIEVHGVGPLVSSAGGRVAGSLAALTVPEPSGEDEALAATASLAWLLTRRRLTVSV